MILSKLAHCTPLVQCLRVSRVSIRQNFASTRARSIQKPVSITVRLLSGASFSAALAYKALSVKVVECKKKTRVVEDVQDGPKKDFDWKLFFHYIKKDWFFLLIAVTTALLTALCNTQIPIYLGDIITVLTNFIRQDAGNSFVEAVHIPAIRLIALYAAQSMFTVVYISTLAHVSERLSARLKEDVFKSVLRQDISYFDKTKTGAIMNVISGDVQDFKSCFKSCVSQGLRSSAQTIGCIVSLFNINPKMTALMLAVVPLIMAIGTVLGAGLRKISIEAQIQEAHAVGVADEAISNIRTVRAFAMEDSEVSLVHEELEKSQRIHSILGLGIGGFQALTNLALNGIVLGVLFAGGKMINEGELSTGNLMSFMVATQMIQKSLGQIFLLFGQYVKGIASGTRVFELIKQQPLIPLKGGRTIEDSTLAGEIRLRNVTFSYPNRPEQKVLDNLTISIPPGKVVALCGASGCGKSTIAALIERFYDVQDGEVLIDGVNVRDLDLEWLRGHTIGLISQEPVLFATSILENIRYGRPGARDTEVMEAAKQANAHDFIMGFEKQYDTILGERGATVSGGQKQRIAIARALLKNPRILILDEATSALDTQSEQIVQQTLDKIIKGRTVLVIAHRLSTIQKADIIYVVHHGKIIESGDHHTLTSLKGAYWRLTQDARDEEKVKAAEAESKSFFRTAG